MHKLNISKLSTQVLEKYFECVFASGKILSLLWFREPYYSKVKLKISESRGTDSSGEDDSDEDEQNGNAIEEVRPFPFNYFRPSRSISFRVVDVIKRFLEEI